MSDEIELDGLRNRLAKNHRHFGKWARRAGLEAYRVYDSDLPVFAFAVDVYGPRIMIQEYAPPSGVDPDRAAERRAAFSRAVEQVFQPRPDHIYVKERRRQRGTAQYMPTGRSAEEQEVKEGPCVFLVDLASYLDTGLFLDHRDTRAWLGAHSRDRRFLNLFCYTATATVHAALGGARSSTSVDLSNTYVDWAERNFVRNGLDRSRHEVVRADCIAWLEATPREQYDLIFIDPPTFSNSKRMSESFDVQRDHTRVIQLAARRLADGGEIVFSNNHRRFKMDFDGLPGFEVRDITRSTIPKDFERNPRIHNCWRIRRDSATH